MTRDNAPCSTVRGPRDFWRCANAAVLARIKGKRVRAAIAALDPRSARRLPRTRRRRGASPQMTAPPAGRNSGQADFRFGTASVQHGSGLCHHRENTRPVLCAEAELRSRKSRFFHFPLLTLFGAAFPVTPRNRVGYTPESCCRGNVEAQQIRVLHSQDFRRPLRHYT